MEKVLLVLVDLWPSSTGSPFHHLFQIKCAKSPNRDTDDVRMASSLAAGMRLQYLTTCIACLILAFIRSWPLTLVILSAVPILTIIQVISQRFTGPLIQAERVHTAVAASFIERAIGAISTVKAFNAQSTEQVALNPALDDIDKVTVRVNAA